MNLILWSVCILSVLGFGNSAKILLMPFYHYSHVNFFTVAGKALKSAGHDMYILTAESYQPKVAKAKLNYILYELPPVSEKISQSSLGMVTHLF